MDRPEETILEQLGGIRGLIYSTLPIVVFVPVNAIWNLTVAIWAALGAAAAVLVWRLITRGRLQPAISGFVGVAICAFIAHRTGSAKGYFLFGIYTSLAYGAVFLISILARWPLAGVIWGYLNGTGTRWRSVRGAVRAYDLATLAWVVVFGARYLVQSRLYDTDSTGWLAATRILMGWPLAGVALVLTYAAIRRADRLLAEHPELVEAEIEAGQGSAGQDGAGQDGAGQDRKREDTTGHG